MNTPSSTLPFTVTEGQMALAGLLHMICPLSDGLKEEIWRNTFPRKVPKGSFLLKPGQVCSHYYFINKGAIRAYIKHGKKEITTWINVEYTVSTSIRSMVLQEPSLEYLQTMEDCDLIVMDYEALEELYLRFPEMNTVGRKLITRYYADAEERAYISRIPNALTRYNHFLSSQPELLNRLPLKFIASYLGMTVETLSRLRGKKPKPRR